MRYGYCSTANYGFQFDEIHEFAFDNKVNFSCCKEVFLKNCCGSAPAVWKASAGGWTCSECGSPRPYEEQQLDFGSVTTLMPPGPKKCDCGGDKANTTHAFYCSVYKP
jgi:hypothetical protein